MNLTEMFQKMNSGEVQAHSELGNRDESKQVRNFGTRIQKMKTVTGINARILLMKDVVIPVNPFTLEADDAYNRKTPFRPILLVSQVIEGIKAVVLQNPELAAKWEETYGVKFVEGPATMDEYMAFKKADFIRPRVMSYYTVAMNFGGVQGFPEFRQKYMVDPTQLNEQGTYDYGPDAPIFHLGASFFNGLLRPQVEQLRRKLEESNASKEQIAKEVQAVYSKSPVGFVAPTNLIPFFYFPLAETVKKFDPKNPKDLESAMRFYSYTDKFTIPLTEARNNPMFDVDIDFFDMTVKTPSSLETKPGTNQVYTDDDSMALYTAMQVTNTDGRIALNGGSTMVGDRMVPNEELYASFRVAVRAYFEQSQEQSMTEGGETFEKIMAASNRFRPVDSVMDRFLPACNEVFTNTFANSPYLTEDFKKQNSVFFTAMNPANAVALADVDDDELEEAAASAAKSVADLIAEATPKEDVPLDELSFDDADDTPAKA